MDRIDLQEKNLEIFKDFCGKNEKSKNETTITVNLPNDVLEGAKEVVEIVNNYLSANAYRDDLFGNLEEPILA